MRRVAAECQGSARWVLAQWVQGRASSGRPRLAVAPLVTAVAALAATACGGHTGPAGTRATTYDAAFTARANAVCAVAVARHAGHPFPVRDFDPLHSKTADLPVVARYLTRYGAADQVAAQLDALAPPAAHQTEWRHLRTLIDQAAANSDRQIAAAEGVDIPGFERTVQTARSLAAAIDQVSLVLGFTPASPCAQVFG
jgi:hypothetical protein